MKRRGIYSSAPTVNYFTTNEKRTPSEQGVLSCKRIFLTTMLTEPYCIHMTNTEGTYQGKTANEWRNMASASNRRSAESFERCDTDGALSQWGSDMMAQQYRLAAHVAEQDGWWEFRALFDVAGNLLDAQEIQTRYGWAWMIRTPQGVQWFNESHARKGERRFAADSKKGYLLGTVKRRAFVKLAGGSITSVSAVVVPDQYDDRFEIVDNGSGKMEYQDIN